MIFALLPLVVLMACQLNTQEHVPATAPLKLSGATENCVGDSLESFENYFKGTADSREIDLAFECFSGALETFATYSRGATDRDSFSSNELRVFLEKHFLGSVKLRDSLLVELMRVKQSLLGGEADRLTKAEINRLLQVLETLRIEAQRLRPYLDIIYQSTTSPVDPLFLEQALSDFSFSMETLGNLLGQSKQNYRLQNLETLLYEIQALYVTRSNWQGLNWFARQMPLLAAAKALLLRPPGDSVEPDEWKLLFSDLGRIYGLYLRFNYAIRDRDLFYGDALGQIEIGVNQVSDILEQAMAAKGGKIEYALMRNFIDILGTEQAFKVPVKASTISNLLEPIFERILNPVVIDTVNGRRFDPQDRLSAAGFRTFQGGLTSTNLTRLRDAVLGWIEMQQLWEQLEKDAFRKDAKLALGQPIPIRLVRELWARYTPRYQEPWSDMKSLLDRPLPTAVYPDGRLRMVPTKAIVIDRGSFSNLNWKQIMTRTLGYGYVSDPVGLRMKGVTLAQLKEIFDDFYPLTMDLKFLDVTDGDIWKTGFTISNIFLFSANGDDRLGFHEAVDMFMFAFASSVISKATIRPDVHANCELLDLDPAGLPKIKPDCWRGRVRLGYPSFFSTMPGWTKAAKSWSSADWDSLFSNAEKAARKPTNPTGPIMSTEMDRVVSIHHYVEALFTRWDVNRNNRLSRAESEKAFYLFQTVLKNASGLKNEEIKPLFFYLLTFGEPPETFREKLYWLYWKTKPEEWEKQVSADRPRIMQIFGNLASKL